MSAVSNLTYVWIQDKGSTSPEKDTTPVAFSNYNEAMSFAKWASLLGATTQSVQAAVWNYNGGSGIWTNAVFSPTANTNWP